MKKHFFCLIICGLAISCSKVAVHDAELAHGTSTFSATVTCVSPAQKDGVCYVGLENGDVVVKDFFANTQESISVGSDRVYDVLEYCSPTDTFLLAGVRNEGLKLVRRGQGGVSITQYKIKEKNSRYAAYSISFDSLAFYVGTSNGCYLLHLDSLRSSTLTPYASKGSSLCYPYRKVLNVGGRVYLASDSGFFVGNRQGNLERILHHSTSGIFCKDSIIYIACNKDNKVFLLNLYSKKNTQIFDNKNIMISHCVLDSEGCKWMLSDNAVYYEQDNSQLKRYAVSLGASIFGRQLMCALSEYVVIAAGNRLFNFSVHQNLVHDHQNVVAVSSGSASDSSFYFLTDDSRLHVFKNGKIKSLKKIKPLKNDGNLIASCVTAENKLFIATTNALYRTSLVSNRRAEKIDKIEDNLFDNVKCLYNDEAKQRVYLGTRYDLFSVNQSNVGIDLLRMRYCQNLKGDLYPVSLYRFHDKLYVLTLNNGLFVATKNDSLVLLAALYDCGQGKSLAEHNGSLLVHTSNGVYELKKNNTLKAITGVEGRNITQLVAGRGRCAAIGNQGFFMLDSLGVAAGLLFRDIKINGASAAWVGNNLVFGSNFGLFKYANGKLAGINVEPEKDNTWTIPWIIIVLLLLLFSLIGWLATAHTRKKRLQDALKDIELLKTNTQNNILEDAQKQRLMNTLEELKERVQRTINQKGKRVGIKIKNELLESLYNLWVDVGNHAVSNDTVANLKKDQQERETAMLQFLLGSLTRQVEVVEELLGKSKEGREVLEKARELLALPVNEIAKDDILLRVKNVQDCIKKLLELTHNASFDVLDPIKKDLTEAFVLLQKEVARAVVLERDLQYKEALLKEVDEALNEIKNMNSDQVVSFLKKEYNIKQRLAGYAHSFKESPVKELMQRFDLDYVDMCILKHLAGFENLPDNLKNHAKTLEKRQEKLHEKLRLNQNKQSHIVGKACQLGIIS